MSDVSELWVGNRAEQAEGVIEMNYSGRVKTVNQTKMPTTSKLLGTLVISILDVNPMLV